MPPTRDGAPALPFDVRLILCAELTKRFAYQRTSKNKLQLSGFVSEIRI